MEEDEMIIDCDICVMDGTSACADCIVPLLLAGTNGRIEVGAEEEEALRNLSRAGLVAYDPLRIKEVGKRYKRDREERYQNEKRCYRNCWFSGCEPIYWRILREFPGSHPWRGLLAKSRRKEFDAT